MSDRLLKDKLMTVLIRKLREARDYLYSIVFNWLLDRLYPWFDHQCLTGLMLLWFERAEPYYRNHGMCSDAHKIADELFICRNLLKRIFNDDYLDMYFNFEEPFISHKIHDAKFIKADELATRQLKQDIEYLFCRMFKRKFLTWWD